MERLMGELAVGLREGIEGVEGKGLVCLYV